MLVGDMLRLNARHRGSDEALVMGDVRLTYRQLNDQVNVVAAALRESGVGPGVRVGVLGRNSLEYVQLYFAAAKIGAILLPLNFWHRASEHQYTLRDAEPRILFVEPQYQEIIGDSLRGIGEVNEPELHTLPGQNDKGTWEDFVARARSTEEPGSDFPEETPHMILYTSGTTGKPKGAVISHERTVRDAFAMAGALGLNSDDRFLNLYPAFHVANWDQQKLYLLVGATVVLLREYDPEAVLRTIQQEGITSIVASPTMLHGIFRHPTFESTDLSSLRLLLYGAYDPSGIMEEAVDRLGAKEGKTEMVHSYGLTEAGPFVTLLPASELFDHWGSIGRPIRGVEVVLLDDEDEAVALGDPGEICIRGPRLSEYWKRPEETERALSGGWFHTGDIAIEDEKGYLRIVDRKKDMIRSGGQNVYSKEVENCLLRHEAVQECAIIGLPDDVYGERVHAVVVLNSGYEPTPDTAAILQKHVRESMAGYNTPKSIDFVSELPMTSVGKVQKHLLRAEYGSPFTGSSSQG